MPEETQQLPEQPFRANFKQTAKGNWYSEFTVRAATADELDVLITEAKKVVLEQLKALNPIDGGTV